MHGLVTGGAGFIGAHLVEWLVEQGHQVRVLDNLSSGTAERLAHLCSQHQPNPVELVVGDICDVATVQAAMQGIERVWHLAALVSVSESVAAPLRAYATNVTGSLHVLEAARQQGVQRVVQMSSCAVYGESERLPVAEEAPPRPLSPYGETKRGAEQAAQLYTRLYGLETVSLRGFNIYGPGQRPDSPYAAVIPRFIDLMRAGTAPTIFGDGEQSRDFIYVGDVVQALWTAATAPGIAGEVFNMGRGKAWSIRALVALLNEVLETRLEPTFAPARPGEVQHSCAATERFAYLTGFQARVDLRSGLQATVQGMQGT